MVLGGGSILSVILVVESVCLLIDDNIVMVWFVWCSLVIVWVRVLLRDLLVLLLRGWMLLNIGCNLFRVLILIEIRFVLV